MTTDSGKLEEAPLPLQSSDIERQRHYEQLQQRIKLLIAGEKDLIAVLATIACELHNAFEYYHWTVKICRHLSLEPRNYCQLRIDQGIYQSGINLCAFLNAD